MENKLPIRKPTRLNKHDYSTVGAYFVTICVKNREQILSKIEFDIDNRSVGVFHTKIGDIIEKSLLSSNNISGVMVDKYVIMPDHIHAIIVLSNTLIGDVASTNKPANEMLPRVISAFKKICNKQIGYNIFQRGYYDHIVRNKEDYETRIKYIHENPTRWYYKNNANS